jgi:hypothetical protein
VLAVTLESANVTAPPVMLKYEELNEATPLFVSVASSAPNVIVPAPLVISIP